MEDQNPHSELIRLRRQQHRTLQNEVYGGLSTAERTEYNRRAKRIHELDAQLQLTAPADGDAAEERREWKKKPETDTPQNEARQPYRTREEDSTNAFTDSLKEGRTKQKHNPETGRE
jgi:hypothetical protein